VASLNEVVTKALDVLRFDRRLKAVAVEKSLDARIPMLRIQPAALEQVIINMVLNATDAMDGVAHPTLKVTTALEGGQVLLAIADNGVGMVPEIRHRIFEPFFTTKPVGKGTGLGLSISYSLVRKHEGHIEVTSTPNQGTTFLIYLPIASEAPAGPSQEKEQSVPISVNVGKSLPK